MKRLLLSGAFALLSAAAALAHGIEVKDPYARSANPRSGAVFMTIVNGGHADRIVAAATPVADRAELHTHINENGVMKMVEIEGGIELPENATVMLERGGLHVMLMGLKAPLKQGQTFPLTLTLESGYDITVEVPVDMMRTPGQPMSPGTMDHGTMQHGKPTN